jgi:hypothetical protein
MLELFAFSQTEDMESANNLQLFPNWMGNHPISVVRFDVLWIVGLEELDR